MQVKLEEYKNIAAFNRSSQPSLGMRNAKCEEWRLLGRYAM
jgi:hypothetical protein